MTDYDAWCRSDPQWALLRERVIWRSRGWCEACLIAKATTAHHLTYEWGRLPPAWHVRAVCTECHRRLHDADDDWCDYEAGMARNIAA